MFWEELNVNDFAASIDVTKGVCVFPIGCLEKHGNHLPLGTDIYIARDIAARAAKLEEMMIFPSYPLGVVAEVKHKAVTIGIGHILGGNVHFFEIQVSQNIHQAHVAADVATAACHDDIHAIFAQIIGKSFVIHLILPADRP